MSTKEIPTSVAWKAFVKVTGGKKSDLEKAFKGTRFYRSRHFDDKTVTEEEMRKLVELYNAYHLKKEEKIAQDKLVRVASQIFANEVISAARRMLKEEEKRKMAIERKLVKVIMGEQKREKAK